ncbi:MAG TPA: hypothetical protein HPP97_16005 [Desulfuromonadales bacterium]|nr:hypothetical protein [Desulfuromonadales bacterium]
MTVFLHRFIFCSALLLATLLPGVNRALAAIVPDVTAFSSISSGLSTPVRLAADSAGALYVADPRGGGIVKFASNGSYTATYSASAGILGLAIASNGEILVSQGSSVAVYTAAGLNKQTPFGTFGKANGIAVTKTGKIFVVDSLNNKVKMFNADYTSAGEFGAAGTTAGKFLQPTGIAYEKGADQLAVTDTRNGRVQFFSTNGLYLKSIGSFGAGPLKFTSPQSVSFEYGADQTTLKRIYVVDAYQSTVQVIDGSTGEFVRYIGGYGVIDGKLITPSDILFNKSSQLVVANGTGKLSLFGVADPSTGPYLQINTIPQATNLSTLTVSGTTTGTSVTVNSVPASISGTNWSAPVSLSVGINKISVIATDASGQKTTLTTSVTASAPALNPVIVTVSPVSSVTSQAVLTLSGTVTAGAVVTVNTIPATVTGTNWNTQVTLKAGANSIAISASKSGMDTSTADLSITLDTSVPVLATLLPTSGSVFSSPLLTISGTVSSSFATTIILTVNGITQAIPVSDGVFSIPVALLIGGDGKGSNSISIAAVDSFGATSQTLVTSVVYNPQAPNITISSPAGAVSGTATYKLAGTVSAGSSVTINGTQNATVSGTGWSADVSLIPGINGFEIKATAPSSLSTTAMTSVAYSPGVPSLSITSPAKDMPVATTAGITFFGTASPGAVVTARVNGTPALVTTTASGAFTVALPVMAIGTYTVTVSATDSTGATSSSSRTIVFDPTPPEFISVSTTPTTISVSAAILSAKDKNGAVGVIDYSTGKAVLTLPVGSYDPTTLNIQAFSPAGLSSRDGDANLDGVVDIADALKALRVLAGLDPQPSFEQMLHGDVGPVVSGAATVDSKIRMSDVIVILEKIIGLSSW